ncbi:hypothetical protein F53441_10758 [Fusarium austroafricanum]|uniref:Uncharacterized protein n=1 Tax=Fusarium austroafricanum TaxID=2364996 RepID=A0A8H4K881_9HYPO|nr:hypothetical protein F53441_10758 [Fusarium austroafricanum]
MYPPELEISTADGRCAVAICLGETPMHVSNNVCDLVNTLQQKFNDIVFLICDEIHKYAIMIPRTMTIKRAQRAAIKRGMKWRQSCGARLISSGKTGQLSAKVAILRWSDIEDQDYHKLLGIIYQYRKSLEQDLRSSSEFYIKRRLAVATLTEERIENFTKYTLAELPVQIMGFNYNNHQYTTIFHPVYPQKNPDGSPGTNAISQYVSPIESVVQGYRNNLDVIGDMSRSVPQMKFGTVKRVLFERSI